VPSHLQLFLGDTNRTISETPMNQASSRSHCIFTIMIEARGPGSDMVRRSKLNLVDLAGSERVAKQRQQAPGRVLYSTEPLKVRGFLTEYHVLVPAPAVQSYITHSDKSGFSPC